MDQPPERSRGRPPGQPKFGGRSKGTPNKKTQHLIELADQLNVNPFEVLLLFAKGDWKALGYESPTRDMANGLTEDTIPVQARLKAAVEAAKYLYPQKKAVEIQNDITPEEQAVLNMFRERLEDYARRKVPETDS